MTRSPFSTHDAQLFDPFDQTDQFSQFAPTPGFHIPSTPSVFSCIDSDHVPNDDCFTSSEEPTHLDQIPLLQLSEWEEGKAYDEHPPRCLHYSIEWKVTLNNRVVVKSIDQDLVLAPRFHWRLFLEPKLRELVCRKFPQKRVEFDDTTTVVSVVYQTRNKPLLSTSIWIIKAR